MPLHLTRLLLSHIILGAEYLRLATAKKLESPSSSNALNAFVDDAGNVSIDTSLENDSGALGEHLNKAGRLRTLDGPNVARVTGNTSVSSHAVITVLSNQSSMDDSAVSHAGCKGAVCDVANSSTEVAHEIVVDKVDNHSEQSSWSSTLVANSVALIQWSSSSLSAGGALQGYADTHRLFLYIAGAALAFVIPFLVVVACYWSPAPRQIAGQKQCCQQKPEPMLLSITDDSGKNVIIRDLSLDTDFAVLRARLDKDRGLPQNERSILMDGQVEMGKDRSGRTLRDLAVGDGWHMSACSAPCQEVPLGIFRTFERIIGGPQGSCIRATVRVGWHGTVEVVIIKSMDLDMNLRFTDSYIIDSVTSVENCTTLLLKKECKTSVIERLRLVGVPGKRTLVAPVSCAATAGAAGLACWTSTTKLLEKPSLSNEDFESEWNLGVPMKLLEKSLDMLLWAPPGENTLLQRSAGLADPWIL